MREIQDFNAVDDRLPANRPATADALQKPLPCTVSRSQERGFREKETNSAGKQSEDLKAHSDLWIGLPTVPKLY